MSGVEQGMVAMLTRDLRRMRVAGTSLAEAALHVVREYDGLHRLSLAVAEWATAVADEGDRARHTLDRVRMLAERYAGVSEDDVGSMPVAHIAGVIRDLARRVRIRSSEHPDDIAVDLFADRMKFKLAVAREKGRGGWDDPEQCSTDHLRDLLHEHIPKGDPVDVANFCMMLAHYGASTARAHQETSNDG